MITGKILQYLNHLQDNDFIAEVITSKPLTELCDIINTLLRSKDEEVVSLACLFIRDLIQLNRDHPSCKEFAEKYPQSSIVKTVEQLLFSTSHFIRRHAIYTLGKTCSYNSVGALNRAFIELRDTDPLMLPWLIGEMRWLGAENPWELVESMMASSSFMTRWAVLENLEYSYRDVQDELYERVCQYLERLRQDLNTYVRQETEYKYQLLRFRSEMDKLPKADRKKRRRALEHEYNPSLHFSSISSAFTYHLSTKGLEQYSVDELEAFVTDMARVR
ncbi:HEAT repeat domain-containing protein [Leptolyngbya sp. FACHB-17]|nr:HEAT repeat domain-containing protein [Leptolyngbya sp. FACHB-17]